MFKTKVLGSGSKNLTLLVKGKGEIDEVIYTAEPHVFGLRIDSAVWVLQEKLTLHLHWGPKETAINDIDFYAMTFESRSATRFDVGLPSPTRKEGWDGTLILTSCHEDVPDSFVKCYILTLDFEKQGAR